MADFSVGHSAVGSVADTISALAPLETAAWMAGISAAGVAALPLVSVPVSPSALSAAIAPPESALSDEEPDALADDDDVVELVELDELELQAARATVAATGRASASHVARLFAISL